MSKFTEGKMDEGALNRVSIADLQALINHNLSYSIIKDSKIV